MNLRNGKILFSLDLNDEIANFLGSKKKVAKFKNIAVINDGLLIFLKNSYALQLSIDGKIQKKGVFAPEGAINPYDFFKELNGMSDALDFDEDINTNGPEMVNIFRSW